MLLRSCTKCPFVGPLGHQRARCPMCKAKTKATGLVIKERRHHDDVRADYLAILAAANHEMGAGVLLALVPGKSGMGAGGDCERGNAGASLASVNGDLPVVGAAGLRNVG